MARHLGARTISSTRPSSLLPLRIFNHPTRLHHFRYLRSSRLWVLLFFLTGAQVFRVQEAAPVASRAPLCMEMPREVKIWLSIQIYIHILSAFKLDHSILNTIYYLPEKIITKLKLSTFTLRDLSTWLAISALARHFLRLMIALYCLAFTKIGPPSLAVLNGNITRPWITQHWQTKCHI